MATPRGVFDVNNWRFLSAGGELVRGEATDNTLTYTSTTTPTVGVNFHGVGSLRLQDTTSLIHTTIGASASTTAADYKLPLTGAPTITGYVLQSDTLGQLSWVEQNSALSWKEPVRVASIAVVDIATGGLLTVDSVGPLVAGDRVLVRNGSVANTGLASIDNGIYIVAVGPWARSADMALGSDASGSAVISKEGTVNADTAWIETTDPGVVNTDNLEFAAFGGAGTGSVGLKGEIQFSNGAGAFEAASIDYTETQYLYSATGPNAILSVGNNPTGGAIIPGSFTIQGGSSTTGSAITGSTISLEAGSGGGATGTGDGGSFAISGGPSGGGAIGNGGSLLIESGSATSINGSSGSVVITGGASTGTGLLGNILVSNLLNIEVVASENSVSTGTGTLRVVGGAGFTQDVYGLTFNATSDVRMKKNIKTIDNPLDKILSMEGYQYDWKDESLNNGKKHMGVLAQQLESVGLKDLVTGTEDKKAVNYFGIISLLIGAVKELSAEVYDLEIEE
jgi:hypothetical protein